MKTIKQVTLYSYDHYEVRFYRVASIESEGVTNLLLPKLLELYPELWFKYGQGSKYLPKETQLTKVKV